MASFKQFNLTGLLNNFNPPPSPNNLVYNKPVWGTFQGDFKRTGSKTFECPVAPLIYIPNCTQKSDSILISTTNMSGNYWVINDSVYRNFISNSINIPSTAKYQILATNILGCKVYSSAFKYLSNSDVTKPSIVSNTGNNNFCVGDSIILSSSLSANSYQWNYGGLKLGATNYKTLSTIVPGPYSVTVYNLYGCSASSDLSLIQSESLPAKPNILWNGSLLSTSLTGVNYQWILNNKAVAGANSITYKPIGLGEYKLQVVDLKGCKNVSDIFNLVVTAINNPSSTPTGHLAKLLPNPATTEVIVQFNQAINKSLSIQLLSNNGQVLKDIKTTNQSTPISVNDLVSGQYIIKISGKDYNQTLQLIIAK